MSHHLRNREVLVDTPFAWLDHFNILKTFLLFPTIEKWIFFPIVNLRQRWHSPMTHNDGYSLMGNCSTSEIGKLRNWARNWGCGRTGGPVGVNVKEGGSGQGVGGCHWWGVNPAPTTPCREDFWEVAHHRWHQQLAGPAMDTFEHPSILPGVSLLIDPSLDEWLAINMRRLCP